MMGPDGLRQALEPLTADLRAVFGSRLRSVVVYGSHGSDGIANTATATAGAPPDAGHDFDPGPTLHTLVLVDRLVTDVLTACAARAQGWHRQHLATPLLLSVTEFERSLDAFPLEYGEIIAHHVVLLGENPFEHARVAPEDVRRACEVQAKSHLVHLREAYIEAAGDASAVAALIAASARPFEALLRNIAHLQGAHARSRDDVAGHAEQVMGIAAPVVRRVIGLLHPNDLSPSDAMRLFPPYLEAVERLATFVDEWAC
jgi:hypothetical protein